MATLGRSSWATASTVRLSHNRQSGRCSPVRAGLHAPSAVPGFVAAADPAFPMATLGRSSWATASTKTCTTQQARARTEYFRPVSSHLQRRPFTGLSTSFQVPRCWSQLSFDRAQQQDMRSAAHKRRQVPARHLAANPGAQNSHPASLFLGMLQWVGRAGCQCSCKGLCCFLGAVHQSRLAMASFPLVTHK
jgi:hypothetical protein